MECLFRQPSWDVGGVGKEGIEIEIGRVLGQGEERIVKEGKGLSFAQVTCCIENESVVGRGEEQD